MKSAHLFILNTTTLSLLTLFVSCTPTIETAGPEASYFSTVNSEAATTVSDQSIEIATECIKNYNASDLTVSDEIKLAGVSLGYKVVWLTSPETIPSKCFVDFGSDGYIDRYGRTLKGKIYCEKSNYKINKFVFSDFSVNANPLKGYKLIESFRKYEIEIYLQDTLILPNGTITHNCFQKRTPFFPVYPASNLKPDSIPNSCEIDGYVNGVNTKGEVYSIVIDKPLYSLVNYKYYVSGTIITTTVKGSEIRNYGNGELDNIATSSINGGVSKPVVLNW